MAQDWHEVLDRRTRTSKTRRLHEDGQPTNTYSWDGIVGTSLHYPEAAEWLEVDPRIVPSDEPGWDWEMRKSHWRFLGRNEGWFAAEKQGVGIGFRLERIAYLNNQTKEYETVRTATYGTPTVEDLEHGNDLLANPLGKLTWANLFPDTAFEIHTGGDGLQQRLKVGPTARNAVLTPPYPYPEDDTALVLVYEVDWGQVPGLADDDGDIDYDTDFERQGRLLLKTHQGEIITALPASKAWPEGEPVDEDGEPIQVPLRKRFVKVGDKHYLLVGAPVLALNALPEGTIIFDPDIDETVGASLDDADEHENGTVVTDLEYLRYGYYGPIDYVGTRFLGVTMPTGQTIEIAYLTWIAHFSDDGDIEGDFYGEDNDTPATFTAGGIGTDDISVRTPTTASVPWNNPEAWTANNPYNSPELKSIIQELEDTYDYSSGLALVLIYTRGEGDGERLGRSWDHATSAPPKLHIEYTAGGATVELAGISEGAATANGEVAIARALAGSSDGAATGVGNLPVTRSLVATSDGAATAAGSLFVSVPLLGAAHGQAAADGAVSITKALAGAAASAATAGGDLTVEVPLAGVGNGMAAASGELTAEYALQGIADGEAGATGDLFVSTPLVGTADGGAAAIGALAVARQLEAWAAGASSAIGNLTVAGGGMVELAGVAGGAAAGAAVISLVVALAGVADGDSAGSGKLYEKKTTKTIHAPILFGG